jgi:hypothetical protein
MKPEMMEVRCDCGQFLGRFTGWYDIRCHKCKKVNIGFIDRVDIQMVRRPKIPREMIPIR